TSVLMSQDRHAIYLLARLGYFEAVWSPFIIGELVRIRVERSIAYGVEREVYRERVNRLIYLLSEVFHLTGQSPRVLPGTLRDPDDAPILAAALGSRSRYVVSLNTRHFPPGNQIFGIRFLTPAEFFDELVRLHPTVEIMRQVEEAGRQI